MQSTAYRALVFPRNLLLKVLDKRCEDAYNVTGKADLFAARLNLFSVCLSNNHWVLVAVDHTKETVGLDYYDSMNGN